MMNIAFVIYREWAYNIYVRMLAFQQSHPTFSIVALITVAAAEFDLGAERAHVPCFLVEGGDNDSLSTILRDKQVSVAFCFGWSWIVNRNVLSQYLCLGLHPSPLPRYRGGTPLQHQIMRGETESAVSVFRMSAGVDDGDIYMQTSLSLEGSLADIFSRMTDAGTEIARSFILDSEQGRVQFRPQPNLEQHPPLRRRAANYELPLGAIASMRYADVHNFVRALGNCYPEPYVVLGSMRIFIVNVAPAETTTMDAFVLNDQTTADLSGHAPLYLRVSDGYVRLVEYHVRTHDSLES